MSEEREMVEEIAAAMVDGMVDIVKERLNESMDGALTELGAFDGEEVPLPGALSDPRLAGELIAEALLARRELYDMLYKAGVVFVKRLKTGS